MMLSTQKVLEALPRSRARALTVEQLADSLSLTESQSRQMAGYLTEFVRAGLAESRGGRFWRKPSTGLLIGTLRGSRSGHAFVVPDDDRERKLGDLYIG